MDGLEKYQHRQRIPLRPGFSYSLQNQPDQSRMSPRLDQYITIQRATVTRSANGAEILTWADWKSRWAEITYQGGSEAQQAGKETASSTVTFKVRYIMDGLTEKDRISFRSQIYDITNIAQDQDGRNHYQLISTTVHR